MWLLLLGAGVLLAGVASYGVAAALILRVVVRVIRRSRAGLGFVKTVVVMMLVTLITAAAHLVVIALWAVVLLGCGEMGTFEKAFYCSAQNYTALGYGDLLLSERWRLLGPLEAINGLLLFGLSTAVMFTVLSHLIQDRVRPQYGGWGEAADSPKRPGAAGASDANDRSRP
jgi:Ion channel